MQTVSRYGRIHLSFPLDRSVDAVRYVAPSGAEEMGPTFTDMPARQVFDRHGYQSVEQTGDLCTGARYTPREVGRYRWQALSGDAVCQEGEFLVEESDHPGYVQVSEADPRYFAFTNGECYVPIGCNMIGPDWHSLPAGMEHFITSGRSATPGLVSFRRWLGELAKNGGNYIRLWLGYNYFEVRTEVPGCHRYEGYVNLDAVMELCRSLGIRVKLTFEYFRSIAGPDHNNYKKLRDPQTGAVLYSIEQWFCDPRQTEIWLNDIHGYIARYWNDPVVMAWEPWNEIECAEAPFSAVYTFTERVLPRIKAMSPCNLVTNSLGSFDEEWRQEIQDAFRDLPSMDYQQVHRYLDQGAPLAICHTDPVALSLDAVRRTRRADKPCLLAETGAVNNRHTGPFRFYMCDHTGTIFNDVTYSPFFAEAAGTGQIWHWDQYVDTQNLWQNYLPFSKMVNGVAVDKECFVSKDFSTDHAYVLALCGRTTTLVYVRNKRDRWDVLYRDGEPLVPCTVTVPAFGSSDVTCFALKGDEEFTAQVKDDTVVLPPLKHGCFVRIRHA